jgi:dolichol-phosphate mannosyltransferase
MKLSVLIPAYQEEDTIGALLCRLAGLDIRTLGIEMEIIVCDDGSRDGTAMHVRNAQRDCPYVKLVSHSQNLGKGAAIRSALPHAEGDYVLIQDADLEYDPADYPAMISAALAGADVVYGSRFLDGAYPRGMRPANFIANKILVASANLLFHLHITDEATGLKLFRTALLRSLRLTCQRFEFCPEVTAKLALLRIPIVEVPVSYQARGVGAGKKVRWTDAFHAFRVLLGWRLLGFRQNDSTGARPANDPSGSSAAGA